MSRRGAVCGQLHDVSTLTCPVSALERDFLDMMKASIGVASDADLVRCALWFYAGHINVPVAVSTFAVRGGLPTSPLARRGRRYRLPDRTNVPYVDAP